MRDEEAIGILKGVLNGGFDGGSASAEKIRRAISHVIAKFPKPKDAGPRGAWVGFDFDGTLATYPYPAGQRYGDPVKPMWDLLERMLAQGIACRIVTARANYPEQVEAVKAWLRDHGKPQLEITAAKDHEMICLFDDRAISVEANTGRCITHALHVARITQGIVEVIN